MRGPAQPGLEAAAGAELPPFPGRGFVCKYPVDIHVVAADAEVFFAICHGRSQHFGDRLRSMVGAPVLFARVDLRLFSDPARERPADAKASLDVNGSLVRAHVAAATITEAVDLLDARLRERAAKEMAELQKNGRWDV